MGRWASSPPTDRLVAGLTLPPGVGREPPHHAIRGKPTSQSHRRGPRHRRCHWTSNGFIGFHVPATGPRRRRAVRPAPSSFVCSSGATGTDGPLTRPDEGAYSGPAAPSRRVPSVGIRPLADHAAAASLPKRNSLPSSHMRCKTTARFLASATVARFMPRRLATSMAQRFSVENRPERVSITFAASYSATRTIASPTLLIPPVTSVSPDWYFLGVRPKCAPTARDRPNRPGSSTAEVKVIATRAPTPGTVINRRQVASWRT